MIGADAAVNVSAASIFNVGFLFLNVDAAIDNSSAGTIGGSANVNFNLTGDLTIGGDAAVDNGSGTSQRHGIAANNDRSIGGNTTINVTAANITANTLTAQIDNTGGSIGGNAAINMNVSGSATVTNDATVAISGNDPAGGCDQFQWRQL